MIAATLIRLIPYNSKNKPWGLYFSKDLFEGFIFGRGLYLERLIIGGKILFQNWLGL